MSHSSPHDLCLALIHADSETEAVHLLKDAGYWDIDSVWRHYGDNENNWATIGNQQSRPDAALIEKLVNSIDARLIQACLEQGIPPESDSAPSTIREAVARFFGPGGDPTSTRAGLMSDWPTAYRRSLAREITLATTGAKPPGYPCFTIADRGEGQTPANFPNTLLSLHKSNKLHTRFVQGQFNMGATGALRFCGAERLQLVVSRRNPDLLQSGSSRSDRHWGFTVIRRREEGGRNTVYSYLAPLGASSQPGKGEVLHFDAPSLPLFPDKSSAYCRDSAWGTLIKLYDYRVKKRSHILRRDGLLNRLNLFLPEIALPVRLHECRRGFRGGKASFDNTLTGLLVRLEENRAGNLEFEPDSAQLDIGGEPLTATVFAFKRDKADTYRNDEGVIFTMNGQTHGYLTTDFFRRKKVGMSYLRDSLLVIVDCSDISARSRNDLFMNSRDRLIDDDGMRAAIERDLEQLLRNHQGLRELRERRRKEDIADKVADDKPLEDVIRNLLVTAPSLSQLFQDGSRLPNPFRPQQVVEPDFQFLGQTHPTFFHFRRKRPGAHLVRDCEIGRRARIAFQTDAENGYFSRKDNAGTFELQLVTPKGGVAARNLVMHLHNGIASLNLELPEDARAGDELEFVATVDDPTRLEPFTNRFTLKVQAKTSKPPGPVKPPKLSGLNLPQVREVSEAQWSDYRPVFDARTALRIVHAGDGTAPSVGDSESHDRYDFFVNVDNIHLNTYLKAQTKLDDEGAKLVRAQFKYGLVLLGLALLRQDGATEAAGNGKDSHTSDGNVEDHVDGFSAAAATVLLPVIRSLGDLDVSDDDGS
ncbi:MAG: hypothetical protein OXG74_11290 [Acidobacteria bacterium]|nr:hypothetical protein [Acidobacteriota bacterium]